ncbi:copper resistance lipoprotein NlpE [Flavobacterium limnosediminis JC2902]|uniref:Copper resistance lipoprotein NlpE n=1 Tax=Flavobacterium limnosediminis JC2902 TaxID=1341181 RepID=V6SRU1_9FLAO|nr:copper resistance protein NlpE [Flavobacterium limnosediminis]ESU29149.1 copper resistance lipoprotein NlpE [Flavobacterium limnosediminis JC2902]
MKHLVLALTALNLTVFGCETGIKTKSKELKNDADTTLVVSDGHTSEISLDWDGTYKGIIPCADCPGIETNLTLNKDKTYSLSVLYQDRDKKPTITKGSFTWDSTGSNIKLDKAGAETQYKVKEGSLVMLDREGKEIESALKSHYVLHKVVK